MPAVRGLEEFLRTVRRMKGLQFGAWKKARSAMALFSPVLDRKATALNETAPVSQIAKCTVVIDAFQSVSEPSDG